MSIRDIVMASSSSADQKLYVDDVFSTYLYTGNGSTQTITNGIDLAGEGGLVWIKQRSIGAQSHSLFDTARGVNNQLRSNLNSAEQTGYTDLLTSFNSNGFTLGADGFTAGEVNNSGTFVSWTFRNAPKFFDVVTYTGDGATNRVISHALGSVPGCIIVKQTNATNDWIVWHRGTDSVGLQAILNSTAASYTSPVRVSGVPGIYVPGALSNQSFLANGDANANGATYVAYLFAHDTDPDGLIQCGSYTGNGLTNPGTGPNVTLGWEPQWVMIKRVIGGSGHWNIFDSMRGLTLTDRNDAYLEANTSDAEVPASWIEPTAVGFQITSGSAEVNNSTNDTYIYLAFRRPNKPPTSGTEVFSPIASSAAAGTALTTNFPVDMQIGRHRSGVANWSVVDRLRGVSTTSTEAGLSLATNSTGVEGTVSGGDSNNWGSTGFLMPSNLGGISDIFYNFRRAPGFFDVVCYTGTGAARTVSHNLGVVPELIIIKRRNLVGYSWIVYASAVGNTRALFLNSTAAQSSTSSAYWNNTSPTISLFTTGISDDANASGGTYVAYLFASLPGISKIGSYTGNGSSQTINCGFSTGARFVLIKRTDSTGDWYVWDTARGIVSANDPHLSLNTTAAEVTTDDSVDPDNSGFIVNQNATTNINVTSATYIFLAIA